MFHDNDQWNAVADNEKAGFLDKVGTIDGQYNTSIETTEIHWRPMTFYKQVALIRLRDQGWGKENLNVYYLTLKGELTRLDGTSPPIHQMNADAHIELNESNILDYVKFFCFFVRGEEGPFLVSETMETYGLPEMDETTKKAVSGVLRDATYEGKDDDGHYLCDAIVFYSNALFLSNFRIQQSGMIEMLEDDPLIQNLDVRVDMPVT
jgi:hypothetical protein